MRIAVLGAGGGLGRNVVDAARAAGHEVVAQVRDPTRAELPADVTIAIGDATRASTRPAPRRRRRSAVRCGRGSSSSSCTAGIRHALVRLPEFYGRFGDRPPTPLADAIATTLAWHRAHATLRLQG